jgi:hypothetical protein
MSKKVCSVLMVPTPPKNSNPVTINPPREKSKRLAAKRHTPQLSSPMQQNKKRERVDTAAARRRRAKRAKSSKPENGHRSYFEEVEDNGITKFVLVHDLTKDWVSAKQFTNNRDSHIFKAESEVPPLQKVSGIVRLIFLPYVPLLPNFTCSPGQLGLRMRLMDRMLVTHIHRGFTYVC